jgi:hypothetical protein
LRLGWTGLTDDGLANLPEFPQLSSLDLSYTSVSNSGLAILPRYAGLEALDVGGAQSRDLITDAGLGYVLSLPKLQTLNASETGLSDASVDGLATLARLKMLDIRSTQITRAAVERLRAALPTCEIRSD